jgi:hypothetical protein
MVPTTTPGEGVTFSVDPVTGQVTTNVPEYEVPAFENIYDAGEGLIGEGGRPIPNQVSPTMGQPLQRQRGGDGRENLGRFLGNRPGISNEVFGDTALRIREDGTVDVIDRNTLDYDFTKAMDEITNLGFLGMLKDETYGEALDRIEGQYGKTTADEVALNVQEQYRANQFNQPTQPTDKGQKNNNNGGGFQGGGSGGVSTSQGPGTGNFGGMGHGLA